MSGGASQQIKPLLSPVYLPWFATSLGLGMLIPVLPLFLRDEDFSFTATSVVLAAAGVGAALGGLPSGQLIAKAGERRVGLAAVVGMGVSFALLGLTTAIALLVVFQVVAGASSIAQRLSYQSYITRVVSPLQRGRSMALMGGTIRASFLIGPLLGGWLADVVGYRWTFAIVGAVSVAGVVPALMAPPRAGDGDGIARRPRGGRSSDRVGSLRSQRRLLARVGPGPAMIMAVRSGRLVVMPLIGAGLGLSNTAVGALVAVSTGADMVLFPVAGYLMDRYGRLSAMVPAFGLFTIGLVLLALATSTAGVVVAGAVIGVGNGMSAGTLLTMTSDLAPTEEPGPFLAAIATMQDTGKVLGPLVVGWWADAAGLSAAAWTLAAGMALGLAWIVLVIGETRPERDVDGLAERLS